MKVNCQRDQRLRLCFLPPWRPPFESLAPQLQAKRAGLLIGHPQGRQQQQQQQPMRRRLRLHTETIEDRLHYCGYIGYAEDSGFLAVSQVADDKVEIRTELEVVRDISGQNNHIDLSVPVRCVKSGTLTSLDWLHLVKRNSSLSQFSGSGIKTRVPGRGQVGGIDDRGIPSLSQSEGVDTLQLELRILDSTRSTELSNVHLDSQVVLDLTLIDPKGFFTDMAVELCQISNSSSLQQISQSPNEDVIFRRCLSNQSDAAAKANFVRWRQTFPGIHYQTSPFLLLAAIVAASSSSDKKKTIPRGGQTFVHCRISLCKMMLQTTCQRSDCLSKDEHMSTFYRYSKFKVIPENEKIREKIYGARDDGCPYSLCLNQLQAIMTSTLLLLLLLLVIVLLLILFKRQRMLHHIAAAATSVGHCSGGPPYSRHTSHQHPHQHQQHPQHPLGSSHKSGRTALNHFSLVSGTHSYPPTIGSYKANSELLMHPDSSGIGGSASSFDNHSSAYCTSTMQQQQQTANHSLYLLTDCSPSLDRMMDQSSSQQLASSLQPAPPVSSFWPPSPTTMPSPDQPSTPIVAPPISGTAVRVSGSRQFPTSHLLQQINNHLLEDQPSPPKASLNSHGASLNSNGSVTGGCGDIICMCAD